MRCERQDSTLAAGVTLATAQNTHRSEGDVAFALGTWRSFGFCADAMLVFMVGMSITVGMIQDHWGAMLVGIGAALLSRLVIICLGLGALSRLSGLQRLSLRALHNSVLWRHPGGHRDHAGLVSVYRNSSLSHGPERLLRRGPVWPCRPDAPR